MDAETGRMGFFSGTLAGEVMGSWQTNETPPSLAARE